MSLIATVIQRGLVKKTLPLSVILGDTLRYGSLDDCFRLKRDRIESNCFVVYQPEEIGRGFLVGQRFRQQFFIHSTLFLEKYSGKCQANRSWITVT